MNTYIKLITGLLVLLSSSLIAAGPTGRGDFSPDAIDINFDQFPDGSIVPNHTAITTHYEQWGVLFSGPVSPTANGDYQGFYGPLTSPPVWKPINRRNPFNGGGKRNSIKPIVI